ncbi:hypothetical protein [Iodidimonas sp. SYSU 1G8]|uniref:hypothetical protein n=1 Tax=Iodidimonas sp. SYSU 1G8 TaxID=3133967 RepID=UPI0031FE455E
MRLKKMFRLVAEGLRRGLTGERVSIAMSGDAVARSVFEEWSAPHPRFRFIAKKQWGPALISLAAEGETYLKGSRYADARRKARRAEKAGFVVRSCVAAHHRAEILAIHQSAPKRQGKAVWDDFVSEADVSAYCDKPFMCTGVFDAAGRLHGYVQWAEAGDIIVFCRLMGHHDSLKLGIMYLLLTTLIKDAVADARLPGRPRWLQYAIYWDGTDGLRQFKRELGFRPYRVKWRWRPQADQTPLLKMAA